MLQLLEVVAVLVVAIVMALSLAHALELPGKLRLSKEDYLAVQPIYYPGFTFTGFAEPLSVVVLIALLFWIPGSTAFWLASAALIALAAVNAIYWVVVHPVNNFWLKDFDLKGASGAFFKTGASGRDRAEEVDWIAYRNRWEGGHVARAVLSLIALVLLATATVL
jgi:Domain of unknown function (DUF1772)